MHDSMKAQFLSRRAAHTSWEDEGEFSRNQHRPYTVALAVQSGEVVRFSLGTKTKDTPDGESPQPVRFRGRPR